MKLARTLAAVALVVAMARPGTADAWRPAADADAQTGQTLASALDSAVAKGELRGLRAIVVAREGRLVLERYYAGAGPDRPHDLRSVTKSIVGLLYGIALADGLVPPVDTPAVTLFPSCTRLARDPRRRRVTVEHLLTMTAGLAWASDLAPRPADACPLAQRIVAEPGSQWIYSGGATAVLGRLISTGAGMPLNAFARNRLFAPLGIQNWRWARDDSGEDIAAYGLHLTLPDLAKIGQLVLDRGRRNGAQVVPETWLAQSFKEHAKAFPGVHYGYHWHLPRRHEWSHGQATAAGKGGQRLDVIPALALVVAIAGGDDDPTKRPPMARTVLQDFVLPAFAK